VRSKADVSQLNLPHGTKTKNWKTEKVKSKKEKRKKEKKSIRLSTAHELN